VRAGVVHGGWSIRATQPSSPLRSEEIEGRVADNLLDGYVVFRCSDPTSTWHAYALRVDRASGLEDLWKLRIPEQLHHFFTPGTRVEAREAKLAG
jgi:hypothetical protein